MSNSAEHQPPDEATVAAYLSNRLDPSREQVFEAYCLRHPDFARRVELDLFLKVGLRQIQGMDGKRRASPTRRTVLAIAAGLAVVVGCGLLLRHPSHPGALVAYQSETELPPALLSRPRVPVTLIRLRASSSIHQIIAPRDSGVLAVRVAPDSPPGRLGYTVSVTPERAVTPGTVTLDNLRADADGYIDLYLPVAALVGQTFRITVNPAPGAEAESLSFRVQVAYPRHAPADTR